MKKETIFISQFFLFSIHCTHWCAKPHFEQTGRKLVPIVLITLLSKSFVNEKSKMISFFRWIKNFLEFLRTSNDIDIHTVKYVNGATDTMSSFNLILCTKYDIISSTTKIFFYNNNIILLHNRFWYINSQCEKLFVRRIHLTAHLRLSSFWRTQTIRKTCKEFLHIVWKISNPFLNFGHKISCSVSRISRIRLARRLKSSTVDQAQQADGNK